MLLDRRSLIRCPAPVEKQSARRGGASTYHHLHSHHQSIFAEGAPSDSSIPGDWSLGILATRRARSPQPSRADHPRATALPSRRAPLKRPRAP